jgi:hypothetical protein
VPSGLVGRVDGCEGQGIEAGIGWHHLAGCNVPAGSISWILRTIQWRGLPAAAAATRGALEG